MVTKKAVCFGICPLFPPISYVLHFRQIYSLRKPPANSCKVCKDLETASRNPKFVKKTAMIPTREQFKEFMAYVQNAQKKEDKENDAFELIWVTCIDDNRNALILRNSYTPIHPIPFLSERGIQERKKVRKFQRSTPFGDSE